MITSKFDLRIPYFIFIASVCSFLISLFLLQLFAGLLVILWLFEKNTNKKLAFDYFGLLILLFGILRIVSILISSYPEESYQSFYKEALFYFSFFAFSYYLKVFDEEKFKDIIVSFGAGAAVAAVIGLILFNLGIVHRAQSFSSGYMTFSAYLLIAAGIAVGLAPLFVTKYKPWYWIAGITLILSGIITSLGRVNIVLAGLVLISGILLKLLKVKHTLIIVVLAAGISFLSFLNNQQEVTQRIEQATGLSDRDIIYKAAGEILYEHPVFGFGPRTFQHIFLYRDMLADKEIGSWHNDILQMYFEGGITGLAAFLLLIFVPLWKGFKSLKDKRISEKQRAILLGLMISIAVLFLSSLTSGFINNPVMSVVFAFQIAALGRIINRKNEADLHQYN